MCAFLQHGVSVFQYVTKNRGRRINLEGKYTKATFPEPHHDSLIKNPLQRERERERGKRVNERQTETQLTRYIHNTWKMQSEYVIYLWRQKNGERKKKQKLHIMAVRTYNKTPHNFHSQIHTGTGPRMYLERKINSLVILLSTL